MLVTIKNIWNKLFGGNYKEGFDDGYEVGRADQLCHDLKEEDVIKKEMNYLQKKLKFARSRRR